jgi:DNA-binding NarL/FixJ family response regulator
LCDAFKIVRLRLVCENKENDVKPGNLTAREREVLTFITDGLSSKEIARIFGISHRTVECHIDHIRRKSGVRKRTSIAAWAIRNNNIAAIAN